jgi:hypothetical protein
LAYSRCLAYQLPVIMTKNRKPGVSRQVRSSGPAELFQTSRLTSSTSSLLLSLTQLATQRQEAEQSFRRSNQCKSLSVDSQTTKHTNHIAVLGSTQQQALADMRQQTFIPNDPIVEDVGAEGNSSEWIDVPEDEAFAHAFEDTLERQ